MPKQVYKCPNHTANLNKMRLNNRWCDLTIKVDDTEIRAHKTVLAANLQYFETMLLGDSFRESKEGVITMECMNATDLEAFITYAYTGEISLTDDNALSLLETANYLGEDEIKQACTEFLKKHLKTEDSFRVYFLTKSIGCLSLQKAAKSRILSNFENSSQSSEYLDLDFESLSDFLSGEKAQPIVFQRILFEGIMRWILHDVKKRRIYVNKLLIFIDVSNLPADYLMKYIGSITNHSDDDFGIVVKDLLSWYHTSTESQLITKHQTEHSEPTLTIFGLFYNKICFQSYNFAKKQWSQPQPFPDTEVFFYSNCAVLNDKFYFIFFKSGSSSLSVFNLSTKLNTVLHTSSRILAYTAVCACSRYLYLCGGMREDGSSSDQVLRYDPQTNSFESLPPMRTPRNEAAAIFYRGYLHVSGGIDNKSNVVNKVEKYDPDTKKWMELPPMCQPRDEHSVAVVDGKLYACGGSSNSVEVYDPGNNSWQLVASMNGYRSHFTLVAYKGKLLAIGGKLLTRGEKTVEVYDPNEDQWQLDTEMSSGSLRIEGDIGGLISYNCIIDGQ